MELMENSGESNEKQRLKLRVGVLEESVRSCEVECRSGRETVLRLLAELDQERRRTASSAAALDSLRLEMDGLAAGRRSAEVEMQTLSERLEAGRRVIEASRRESSCLQKQLEELERKAKAAERKLQMFLEKVSGLLQARAEDVIPPTERCVLQELGNLCNKTVSDLETRLRCVSEELGEQSELQRSTQQRAKLAEQQVQDLRERLQAADVELQAADVQRDGLRRSKLHYEEFLDQLTETMKVDSIAADLDFDMKLKLILTRTQQLIRQEGASLVESKGLTYTLQRKLKTQKEQLESKELHVQLLRRKLSEVEEERRSRSALAAERDDALQEVRRLQRKMERLHGDLKSSRMSNTELKEQLGHSSELKLRVTEQQKKKMEQLEDKMEQLEERKTTVERNLSTVTSDLQSRERKSREDEQQLGSLRESLDLLSERHRELVDFRTSVSHMFGLDTAASSLPDSEIIDLLETLLHTHHHHHLHHHGNTAGHCPAQRPLEIQDCPDGATCREEAVSLHQT
ncbi:coiled-coil domain-containing protein 170 [Brachyistius frenatus]|uniref:coiled-coil domain-containing protein 170 n=1 Tax=Brachyistius frenatus TaxID=100188 RepID=UPI0037E9C707